MVFSFTPQSDYKVQYDKLKKEKETKEQARVEKQLKKLEIDLGKGEEIEAVKKTEPTKKTSNIPSKPIISFKHDSDDEREANDDIQEEVREACEKVESKSFDAFLQMQSNIKK